MDIHSRPRLAVLIPVTIAAATIAILLYAAEPWKGLEPGSVAFIALILALTLLPYVIVATALALGRSNAWVWWAALVYGSVTGLGTLALYISVLMDESSTAVLAFVFVPIYQLLGIAITSVAVLLAKYVHDSRQTRRIGGGAELP